MTKDERNNARREALYAVLALYSDTELIRARLSGFGYGPTQEEKAGALAAAGRVKAKITQLITMIDELECDPQ